MPRNHDPIYQLSHNFSRHLAGFFDDLIKRHRRGGNLDRGEQNSTSFLEHQLPILRANLDPLVRLKLPRQQLRCERVEQVFLDGAFERTRAELRFVAWNCLAKELLDLRRVSARLPP